MDVAYVLFRFPALTETFITQEIMNVQGYGIRVHLYSLLRPKETLGRFTAGVHYAPEYYDPRLWLAQIRFVLKDPSRYVQRWSEVVRLAAHDPWFLLKCLLIFWKSVWIAGELDRSPVELIHSHFAWLPGLAGSLVARFLDLPYTVTTHAYDLFVNHNSLLSPVVAAADGIVTISQNNVRVMREHDPDLDPKLIQVIRCGIDLELFHPAEPRAKNTIIQITSVGSLIEKKGHEYLIRACKVLALQGLQFDCVIVGTGSLERALMTMIRDLQLDGRVRLAGYQTSAWIRDRLSVSDLFVLACVVAGQGDRDGIPVAIMEAMAMGVPVISTPVSGIAELVEHEETGLLVPERDDQTLAAAMSRLMGESALREKVVRQARTRVESEYDVSKNAGCLAEFFRQVVQEKRAMQVL